VKITVLYVGGSLLGPLRKAEQEINRRLSLGLEVAAYNCGATLDLDRWSEAERDIRESAVVFIIHVTDEGNASLIAGALDGPADQPRTVIAFNCMPALMRRTRMGRLDFGEMMKARADQAAEPSSSSHNLVRKLGSWMADYVRGRGRNGSGANHSAYLKLINRLPSVLKLVPARGKLADIKHYLLLFAYFLQPTPDNIRSMLLYAIRHYVAGNSRIGGISAPETMPAAGIYHPDAPELFKTFQAYRKWYERARGLKLDERATVGLLLMRPQIVSRSRRHYDRLIHAIEEEGLAVVPAISTFMDNREACRAFFVDGSPASGGPRARVSQVVSLTGFSFVGGPAMNDSEAATEFFKSLGVPFRSVVSLDVQSIENWEASRVGLNPVQAAMQVAIPELDGATEPFVFGGLTQASDQPEPIEDRCRRIARRLARWNRLRVAPPADVRLALMIFCFPPNKGNIGTAADLDVFPSLIEILRELKSAGYIVDPPESAERLREMVLDGNAGEHGMMANVVYRISVDEYRRLCPHVDEIEKEWGRAPGRINSNGEEVLILGVRIGNVFIGVQPTFGYEGDPMRLLAAEGGSPHHGFMAMYTFIEKVFRADAVVHVGTHGSLEFMPGKQAGLSSRCWPDRLIGELPNIYLYSVNNPSEGTIAKRRSYAELVSYLTPPIANAGLYKELVSMKELLTAYRQARGDSERERLFAAIEAKAASLHL